MMFRGVHNYIQMNATDRAGREILGVNNLSSRIWGNNNFSSAKMDAFENSKKKKIAKNAKTILTSLGIIGGVIGGAFLLFKGKKGAKKIFSGIQNTLKNIKKPNLNSAKKSSLTFLSNIPKKISDFFSKFKKAKP